MRTALSLGFLLVLLWASCTVKLGRYTLAEHVDRIGQTDEARALLDGTRGRISPALEEMKQRVFGERVEAPTARSKRDLRATTEAGPTRKRPAEARAVRPPADAPRRPSSAEETRLPRASIRRDRSLD